MYYFFKDYEFFSLLLSSFLAQLINVTFDIYEISVNAPVLKRVMKALYRENDYIRQINTYLICD